MISSFRPLRWLVGTGFSVLLLLSANGCGPSGIAAVEGKVVDSAGKPVTGGTLIFTPVAGSNASNAGRPSSAEIGPDGVFKLTTTDGHSGAQIGKNRVIFTPPEPQLTEQQRTDSKYIAPPPLYIGQVPDPAEIEITSGVNTISLKLKPGKK